MVNIKIIMILKFYISRIKMFKLLLVSAFIAYLGIYSIKSNSLIINIIGVLNIIIGFTIFTVSLIKILIYKEQLILTESKIKYTPISSYFFPFSNIKSYKILKKRNMRILELRFNKNLNSNKFKYLYKKTAKKFIDKGIIRINIDQIKVDDTILIKHLDTYISLSTKVWY